tara:strand:- start:869 stop:1756 length:888 start_codon:yes stop_codon:yes gene_type:complete
MQLKNLIISKLNNGQGNDHFSPSQLTNKPIAWWMTKYLLSSQDDRRKSLANYKMHYGNLVGNTSQHLICKYIFKGAERKEIKDRIYETIYEHELKQINKNKPRDEKDGECRTHMLEYSHQTITQILKAVKKIFGKDSVQGERYVHDQPDNLFLPIIGRIDFESANKIAELKSKPPYFRLLKTGLKGYTQKLPIEPQLDHIAQLSFYWHCCKRKPFLFYVNEEDYKIFDEFTDEYLEHCYQTYIVRKAKTIQRLLEASKGDASIMADLVEAPDMKHYLYSDLTEHQQQQINKLWGI